jgi:hypothetical protein
MTEAPTGWVRPPQACAICGAHTDALLCLTCGSIELLPLEAPQLETRGDQQT